MSKRPIDVKLWYNYPEVYQKLKDTVARFSLNCWWKQLSKRGFNITAPSHNHERPVKQLAIFSGIREEIPFCKLKLFQKSKIVPFPVINATRFQSVDVLISSIISGWMTVVNWMWPRARTPKQTLSQLTSYKHRKQEAGSKDDFKAHDKFPGDPFKVLRFSW